MSSEIYELISLSIEVPYESLDDVVSTVCEGQPMSVEDTAANFVLDADGIPMGRSKEEIKIREKQIKDFYAKWIAENPQKRVWNENLSSFIFVKYLSINETYNKAARSYESTKAVFRMSEILQKAHLVEELPVKPNNKNQKAFSKMLVMRYENVKLTVGHQKTTDENVQYSITEPQK